MAEISVPAWPMPIQKTKLVMSKAQNTGTVVAPHADAGADQVGDQQGEDDRHRRRDGERDVPVRGGCGRSTTRQTVSVTEAKSWSPGHQRRPVQRIVGRVVEFGGDAHRLSSSAVHSAG